MKGLLKKMALLEQMVSEMNHHDKNKEYKDSSMRYITNCTRELKKMTRPRFLVQDMLRGLETFHCHNERISFYLFQLQS
jgi:hypothetical protein